MRKKISNFTFEKFVFFLFLFALALISGSSAEAQTIISDSSNILEIKANSSLTTSTLRFVPSTSVNSFSLQGVGGGSSVSIFEFLPSSSLLKMMNGTLNYNSSNNRIGIGTTAPSEKLEVAGNIFMNTGYLMQTDTWGMKWKFAGDSDTVEMNSSETAWKFNIAGGGVTKYRFNSSKTGFGPILDLNASGSSIFYGNVGIGTTAPSYKLDVAYHSNGVNFNGNYLHNVSAPSTTTDAINKGYLDSSLETYGSKWILSGSNLYPSSTAWNVGIGTAAPQGKLEVVDSKTHVSGDLAGTDGILRLYNNYNVDVAEKGSVITFEDNYLGTHRTTRAAIKGGTATSGNTADGFLAFYTDASVANSMQERMRINHAGNVGIGTTAPGAFRLFVNGATYTSGNLNVGGDATISGGDVSISNNNGGINFNDASAYWLKTATNYGIYWDTTANQFKFNGAGVTKASIDLDDGAAYFNGSVGIGTNAPSAKLTVSGGNIFITDAVIGSSTPHAAVTKTYLDSAIQALASTTSYWTANGTHIFNTNTGNVGVGTSNPGQQLEITKNFRLPDTVGATPYGVIYKGGDSFIHNFQYGLNGNGVTTSGGNTFVGINAGNLTMGSTATSFSQSSSNTGVGYYSLFANTTGYGNSALGYQTLLSNTTGNSNSALGYLSLSRNTTGYSNSALGYLSLENNTTGGNNSALGYSSLRSNTTGGGNSAFGYDSLVTNSTGSFNSAFGNEAGKLLATGGVRTTGNFGLYLGHSSKASADGTDNEIVIGALAVGNGSNSVTLGNDSIAKTVLKGNVGIGTTTPAAGLEVLTGSNYSILAGGKRVGNVAAPVTGTDAVNRNYVDSNFIASTSLATITKAFVQGGNSFGEKAILGTNDNQALGIKTNGTEKMTILANGNVGIGTTNPIAKLQIGSDWSAGGSGTIYLGSSGFALSNLLPKQIITTNSTDTIPGRNIGLALHNSTATAGAYAPLLVFSTMETGASTYNGAISAIGARTVTGSGASGNYIDGEMMFYTAPTAGSGLLERMRITEGGNVGVGTTNPLKKLQVAQDLTYNQSRSGQLYLSSTDGVKRLMLGYDTTNNFGFIEGVNFGTAYSNVVINPVQGNVGIGTTAPTHKLHVAGDASFSDNQIHGVSAPATGTDAANRFYVDGLIADLSSQITHSYWSASGNNIFNNNTGNVGIGTNTPSQKLDVVGSVNVSTGYRINNIATNGKYLRGNGTNFVESSIQAGDVPTLNQNTDGYAGNLVSEDNRAISPSELVVRRMKFGFTSYANNSSSPYADFLHFNSYGDVSGGNANLLVINKSGIGMRLYQQVFGTTTNFSAYKDVVLANNTPALNYLTKYASTGNSVTVSSSQVYDNGTKVGIGTTAPSHKLHVVGEGNFNSNQVHGVSSPTFDTDVANQGYVKSSVEGSAFWKLSGSNVYTSSTAWNVGIGVNNPGAYKLFVAGNSYLSGKVNIGKSDSYGELEILHNNNISDPDTSFYPLRIKNDSWSGNQITGIEFWNGSHKTVPTARIISQMAGSGGDGENLHFQTQTKSATNPNPNEPTTKMTITNTGEVGIGTTAPSSKLHVVGSSYLNGTIQTALTGTGSRCLHVDSNGVIGTMAGDCGTSTGGDNLGNGIASTNIALGNYWLSGDGGNEGIFVKSDGKVGIGDSNPAYKLTISGDVGINGSSNSILFNLHTGSASGRSYLNFQSDEAYGSHTYSIDSLYALTSNPTLSGAMLSLNPSGGGVFFGGSIVVPNAVYNAGSSRWLSFGPSGDSLKVAGNLNTTAGALNVSGTGNSWIMGKLGIGTTNPNSTAGMTIDTAATAPSIWFRHAGVDKGMLTFKNGFFLGKDDTASFSYSGVSNIGIGHGALERGSGDGNIAIGELAAYYNNAANNNIAIGNGAAQVVNTSGNIALGWQAFGSSGATGGNNIAIGVAALANGAVQKNIAIGDGALNTVSVGSYNIAIGNRGAAGSNKLYIGDLNGGVSPYTPLIYGDMTSTTTGAVGIKTTNLQSGMAMTVAGKIYADDFIYSSSDARLKHDIKNLGNLDYQKILKLRPVSFTYNKNNSKGFGFIAQELEKIYPEMVETNQSDGMKSVTYDNLISPTIMAIQEQQKKIEEQETLIHILLDRVNKLENSTK